MPIPPRAPPGRRFPSAAPRAAVWLLALSGLFTVSAFPGVGGLAHADVLVSNLGQTTNSEENVTDEDAQAQLFGTGSNAAGYDLTSVEVDVASVPATPASVTARIVSVRSNGRPGAKVFDLANPATFSVGANVFTAPPGASLSANTGYFLVVAYDTTTSFGLNGTNSDDEDSEGATGWTIHDLHLRELVIGWCASPYGTAGATTALKIKIEARRECDPGRPPTPPNPTASLQANPATTTALALALTYDEDLDADSEPAPSAFTVTVDGASRTVTGVSVLGDTKVRLTLAPAVRAGRR